MTQPPLRIRIDHLVLDGADPAQAQRMARTLATGLAERLLTRPPAAPVRCADGPGGLSTDDPARAGRHLADALTGRSRP